MGTFVFFLIAAAAAEYFFKCADRRNKKISRIVMDHETNQVLFWVCWFVAVILLIAFVHSF